MYLPLAVTVALFSYWLLKKRRRVRPFKLPIDVQTGDVVHGAFGSLLANMSIHGMHFDVAVGVVLYLAYQIAGYFKEEGYSRQGRPDVHRRLLYHVDPELRAAVKGLYFRRVR